MKKYGIYLSFPITTDLRKEGLGRQLAAFLSGALQRSDVEFVIACTSWVPEMLKQLFDDYNINYADIEFIYPSKRTHLILKSYNMLCQIAEKSKVFKGKIRKWSVLNRQYKISKIRYLCQKLISFADQRIGASLLLALGFIIFLPFILVFLLLIFLFFLFKKIFNIFKRITSKIKVILAGGKIERVIHKIQALFRGNILQDCKKIPFLRDIFSSIEKLEEKTLVDMINKRQDISAWYSPVVFLSQFHAINRPKLLCVPDMVFSRFPINFSILMGGRQQEFNKMQEIISKEKHFVTYSHDVKIGTLVKDYHIDPENIFVIPHGANTLKHLIDITGSPDDEKATESFCKNLFSNIIASHRIVYAEEIDAIHNSEMKYIFYASQVRPNKNIVSLLRAYKDLLRKRYIPHKLILTGTPHSSAEVDRFIIDNRLQNDVLWLHGLSSQQLAALYKLADLAVNPSLSEGGCPFTFTEALSVDTPVVMAKIKVTEEILTDAHLQKATFFDPYDYNDMAHKIEWALKNRESLLAIQKPFYTELAKRDWNNVVDDYIKVLDKISQ